MLKHLPFACVRLLATRQILSKSQNTESSC